MNKRLIENVASGQVNLNEISVDLKDFDNQTINIDSESYIFFKE